MKHKAFYDANHANRYLVNSIIRVGGVPAKVVDIGYMSGGEIALAFVLIPSKGSERPTYLPASDPKVDMNPIPLGMCNVKNGTNKIVCAYYLARKPSRQWQIGLRSGTLGIYPVDRPIEMGYEGILNSISLVDCATGKYPKFSSAMDILKRTPNGIVAFSRSWAIDSKNDIFYKDLGKVGSFTKDRADLKDNYHFLSESFDEDLKNAA